jgi:peroxiredoxin
MARATSIRKGELIPAFMLEAGNRPGRIGPWDYKQRTSLVVLLLHGGGCERCRAMLGAVAGLYGEVRAIGAEVLAVVSDDAEAVRRLALETDLPFPLLADGGGSVRTAFVGEGVGLALADRYNALFEGWSADDADGLPEAAELREWLAFLDMQCDECHPPEPWGL